MSNLGRCLNAGRRLAKGDYLTSSNGKYQLILQDDGNLVLYNISDGHRPTWASNTQGQAVRSASMQVDGNFVIYGYPNAIWATGTDGKRWSLLLLQDDGNVVIYAPISGTPQGGPIVPVWASNTAGQ